MAQRRLFISYSRKDQSFVEQLATDLVAEGVEVWLDLKDILPGTNWGESIQEGLDTADVMLLIVSPDSMASQNVSLEWEYYFDNKKQIVPILYKPAKIPFQISRLQYVDFANSDYQKAMGKLKGILSKPPSGNQPRPEAPSTPVVSQSQTSMVAPRRSSGLPVIIGASIAVIAVIVVGLFLLSRFQSPTVATNPTNTPTARPIPTDVILTATTAATNTSPAIAASNTPLPSPTSVPIAASSLSGKIAYVVSKNTSTSEGDLYIMDADGKNQKQLTNASKNELQQGRGTDNFRWLKDGQHIVFTTSSGMSALGLYQVNIDNSNFEVSQLLSPATIFNLTSLTPDMVSPDGKNVILAQAEKCSLYEFATKVTTILSNVPGICSLATWSPDGSQIAFYSPTSDSSVGLYILTMSSGKVKLLVDHVMDGYSPVWSPDSASLLYYTPTTNNNGVMGDLNLVSVRNGKTQPVAQSVVEARWSPDGKHILWHKESSENTNEVLITSVDNLSGQSTPLILENYWPGSADWSPDGSSIVFSGFTTDQKMAQLYMTSIASFNASPLLSQADNVNNYNVPRWQPIPSN